ncbi:hypothetical protein CAPTEDRAFT_171815 [Capitella teleta]|uniref:DRBM domain-containing protein n=1 Tax=Capitella teleta TaxID=283909 RepID=R7VGX1_CAPTE|nr:hypothetical protein CAPTEDRAFT_171815 [Capitella teleta]|eukprot:ELU17807.1 hypothetical protein CAPTEDRAFT_171815 [Capitella teleta]
MEEEAVDTVSRGDSESPSPGLSSRMSSYLSGKTPISYLQELCTKRGLTPQYDLIANEGAVHEPTFVFKVVVGDIVGTGKGPSKKKAKHNAAVSVLNQLHGVQNSETEGENKVNGSEENGGSPDPKENGEELDGDESMVGNPVGELQEMTQKKLWPPPVYDYTSEQGPPHAREFICTVRLFQIAEQGVGRSKKLAKRNAAHAMLDIIKKGLATPTPDVTDHIEEHDEDNIPMPQSDVRSSYSNLKDGVKVATLNPQASQRISQFYQGMKARTGKNLQALQQTKALNTPGSTNYCQMLQEIAEEQRFEVTYVDIQEISVSGNHQCLVQLSTMPVAVCHGTAPTRDEAHGMAAHNALQYLKIMTRKA